MKHAKFLPGDIVLLTWGMGIQRLQRLYQIRSISKDRNGVQHVGIQIELSKKDSSISWFHHSSVIFLDHAP